MYFTESQDKNQPLGSLLNGSLERVTTKFSWKIGLPPQTDPPVTFMGADQPNRFRIPGSGGAPGHNFSLLDSTYRAKAKPY
jgi:hypothetical protein